MEKKNAQEMLNSLSYKKKNVFEEASAEEAFYIVRDYYGITSEDVEEIRRILAIRYAISTQGYSATKSIEIVLDIEEDTLFVVLTD